MGGTIAPFVPLNYAYDTCLINRKSHGTFLDIMGIFNVHSTKDSCGPLMELLASKGLTYEESIVKDPFGQMALYMSRFFLNFVFF